MTTNGNPYAGRPWSAGPQGPGPQAAAAPSNDAGQAIALFRECFHALAGTIERSVKGKREVIELTLTCLFAEGHLLLEDVPGTGKTTLARALAASLDATCHRVQFTPDLLPSDITGITVYRQGADRFEFVPGPVFANVVIGDEINRASPKTQSALLEVMEEARVTVNGETHDVPRPFMVVATQNPVDMAGTYPLPEAQLDRFLMRLTVGYPDHAAEVAVATPGISLVTRPEALSAVATARHVREFVHVIRERVTAVEAVVDYAVRLCAATRAHPLVRLGAGPRGSVALIRAALVRAAAAGRTYTLPEDIKALAPHVLPHRLILTPEAELSGQTATAILQQLLSEVPISAVPYQGVAESRA